jgi:sugar (pentulose or hexulose) kinase
MLKLVEHYSGKDPETLIIVDDEARSAFWNQMKADITGRVVCSPRVIHGAAMGAAVLASQAAGLFKNTGEAVKSMIKMGPRYEPDPVNQAIYQEAQERYERLYKYMDQVYTAS